MGKQVVSGTVHRLGLLVVLAAVWLLWSGHFTGLLLGLGAVSCVLVVYLSLRMELVDEEGQPVAWGLRPLRYFPWLIWEIVKSNIDVTKIILHPSLPISPTVTRLPVPQKTDLGGVLYANSITLTPGTVSIELDEDSVLVHALSRDGIAGLESGEMSRRVSWLEGLS